MKDGMNPKLKQLQALADFRYVLRRFLRFSETEADAAGLHAQQYQLMQVVAASTTDGIPPMIAHVAERMMLRHNSAVGLIDRTAEQGLLRRVPDEKDHRKMRVRLTAKGERTLEKLVDAHLAVLGLLGAEIQSSLNTVLEMQRTGPGARAKKSRKPRRV